MNLCNKGKCDCPKEKVYQVGDMLLNKDGIFKFLNSDREWETIMTEQEPLLTEAQASRVLGTTKATVKKWALRGKIPHSVHPVNGRRRYQKEVLDKLVKDMGKWI